MPEQGVRLAEGSPHAPGPLPQTGKRAQAPGRLLPSARRPVTPESAVQRHSAQDPAEQLVAHQRADLVGILEVETTGGADQ